MLFDVSLKSINCFLDQQLHSPLLILYGALDTSKLFPLSAMAFTLVDTSKLLVQEHDTTSLTACSSTASSCTHKVAISYANAIRRATYRIAQQFLVPALALA